MIPAKLTLHNFMPYRDADLPFDGLSVACLCGDNGNGKSALLDALTWALWGRARARTDDELIHQGMTEMAIEFEFYMGKDRYRVIRKRSKPKAKRAGHSLLDLQIANEDGFRSISGNSIRETGQKISKILRMDYETFINSAYLRQGQADRFSRAEPYKRKEILGNVLGLSRYDELESLAKEHAKRTEIQRKELETAVQVIDDELATKGEYEAQLGEVTRALAELEDKHRTQADKVNTLAKQKHELDLKKEQGAQLEERVRQSSETIASFEGQIGERRQRVERYEKILADYDDELSKVQACETELAKQESELESAREELQNVSSHIHHLTSNNSGLKQEMVEFKEKMDMLSQGEANCPLCGRELGAEELKRIVANYESQGQEKKERFRSNEDEIRDLEKSHKGLKQAIGSNEQALKHRRAQWEQRKSNLERDHAEAQDALPKEREAITEAEKGIERWRSTVQADSQRLEALNSDLAVLPQLESDLSNAQQSLDELTERLSRERQRLGAVQEKLDRCAKLDQTKKVKTVELKTAIEEEKIYQELAAAFGKKGIQAMLIENALPDIEEEANRLLARMTDGRMNVKIESQRPRKSREGEPMETLDINISDELGTRSYEMYSGGEAFRIDFALRIALSKLLARRAGAPLPTLIVDEGFGSQDAGGRERLVEAINSIQDDFDMILVITHIDELKEAFPARIEVTKTAEGSCIELT